MNYLRLQKGKSKAANLSRVYRSVNPMHRDWYSEDSIWFKIAVRTRVRCSCIGCRGERYQRSREDYFREIQEWADDYDRDSIKMTDEEFDRLYGDEYFEAF